MALSKISETVTAIRLSEGKLKDLRDSMPIAIADAIRQGEPLVMMEKVTGENSIIRYIEFELIETTRMMNMNPGLLLQKHQIPLVAKTLYDNFKNESLEDFSLALKRGAAGFYNPEGLFRLDGAVITQWIQRYLEEKYAHIEQETLRVKSGLKKEETEVDYKLHIKRKEEERNGFIDEKRQKEIADAKKNNEYEIYKLKISDAKRKYWLDGMTIDATSEEEARKAYKAFYDKEPETVKLFEETLP